MDKYQSNLLGRGTFTLKSPNGDGGVSVVENAIRLEQNENYAILSYCLVVENPMIEAVKLDDVKIESRDNKVEVPISFEKQAQAITLFFKNGFAEPCKFGLEYVFANKDQYDTKVLEQRKSEYLATMNLTCRAGMDLINVYWRPACSDVATITVRLSAECDNGTMLMEKVDCPVTVFYKVFANLAYGKYHIEVLQKDAAGNELISKECRIAIDDPFTKLGNELSNQLGAVKSQVAASGKNTVTYGQ